MTNEDTATELVYEWEKNGSLQLSVPFPDGKRLIEMITQALDERLEWAAARCATSHAGDCCHETAENNAKAIREGGTMSGDTKDCEDVRTIAELKELLYHSEQFRIAYRKGKLALYAMGGEVAEAAMKTLPCSEGPLDSAAVKALGERTGWVELKDYDLVRTQRDNVSGREKYYLEMLAVAKRALQAHEDYWKGIPLEGVSMEKARAYRAQMTAALEFLNV